MDGYHFLTSRHINEHAANVVATPTTTVPPPRTHTHHSIKWLHIIFTIKGDTIMGPTYLFIVID